jgi:hypothetical protein
MSEFGFTIIELSAVGPEVVTASLPLKRGLNVISGASDTGKTFLFQAVNFMLGGSHPPKRIPQANGYTEIRLSLEDRNGNLFTLARPIRGGNAQLFSGAGANIDEGSWVPLHSQAAAGREDTISAFLLGLVDLKGRKVRRNAQGEVRELSFRDLAHLNTIGEERMFSEGSPIVGGQYTLKTVEQSVFKLLVTGEDDSGIPPRENPKVQRAEREATIAVLSELIGKYEREFAELVVSPISIVSDIVEVNQQVQELNRDLELRRNWLKEAQEQRREVHRSCLRVESRRLLVAELVNRFHLLEERYESDLARLAAVSEASGLIRELPIVECPFCHAGPEHQAHEEHRGLADIRDACRVEAEKIQVLLADLQSTASGTRDEEQALQTATSELQVALSQVDESIEDVLKPMLTASVEQLEQLNQKRSRIERARWLAGQIEYLSNRRDDAPTVENAPTITVSPSLEQAIREICGHLEQTLRAWKFPNVGPVVFDSERQDFVIGFRERHSFGKGIRALIYTAFTVSTLRFCSLRELRHPGFVVLDSPLVAYREPDLPDDERIGSEVKTAFFENLAGDDPDEQVIIFDNEDPPDFLVSRLNHIHFSKTSGVGRYGFFPER